MKSFNVKAARAVFYVLFLIFLIWFFLYILERNCRTILIGTFDFLVSSKEYPGNVVVDISMLSTEWQDRKKFSSVLDKGFDVMNVGLEFKESGWFYQVSLDEGGGHFLLCVVKPFQRKIACTQLLNQDPSH